MEVFNVLRNDKEFDKAVHGGSLMDVGDKPRALIFKDNATTGGMPGAVITFWVQTPDGKQHQVQTVVTARLLHMAFSAMMGWYGDQLGGYAPPPIPGQG